MTTILIATAILLYLLSAALLLRRLAAGIDASLRSRHAGLAAAFGAMLLHATAVYHGVVDGEGLNLSFFIALSFTSWVAVALILFTAIRQPIENIGIVVFPFAAMSLLLQGYQGKGGVLLTTLSSGLELHILISVISYSLLTLAALQAVLLAVQTRQLRNRHPGGFIRALPPLEMMEAMLFRLIGIGYLLLSLSLLSGVPYAQDLMAQHLIHKTVLSITAWILFAILLWGRWRFGWRGRTAIRWTLGGFVALMLAYFGSKLVLELILGV